MTETPADDPGAAPVTGIEESDPNADSAEGLAGDMGVSSERKGPVRGQAGEVTYAAAPTHPDDPEGDPLPEQSAHDGQPETNPESPGRHESDPDSNPRHGV
ncbi:MAG: hypothetical protein ABIR34_00680 [Marmoricola sp.]